MSRHHHRLSGPHWERARRQALDRDRWRCRSCGYPADLEVDHVVPLSRGGDELALDNLQVLCTSCHVEKTAGELVRDPQRRAWRAFVRELVS